MARPAGDEDPLAAGLQKRDKAFLMRMALRLAVIVLLGVWLFLSMDDSGIGGCAARGFNNLVR